MLLSASIGSLQTMVNICGDEISSLDIRSNVSKSYIFRIGKRYKSRCSSLVVSNMPPQFVHQVKYLGVCILSGPHFRLDINKVKTKFYIALNCILSKCRSSMNETVTLYLINAFCRPLLLYGCDCVPLSKLYISSLSHSWNHVY